MHKLENKVFTDRMLLNKNHKEIKHNLRYAQELHLHRNCKLKLTVFVQYLRSHKGICDIGAEDVNVTSARNKMGLSEKYLNSQTYRLREYIKSGDSDSK